MIRKLLPMLFVVLAFSIMISGCAQKTIQQPVQEEVPVTGAAVSEGIDEVDNLTENIGDEDLENDLSDLDNSLSDW